MINSTYEVIDILRDFPKHCRLKKKKELKKSAISISAQFPKFGQVIYFEYNNKFDWVPSIVQTAVNKIQNQYFTISFNSAGPVMRDGHAEILVSTLSQSCCDSDMAKYSAV